MTKAPRPSLRQAHKDLTRQRITVAARHCFYTKGFAETSMEEISVAAGVQRTTMYSHFSSKNAILVQLFAESLDYVTRIYGKLADLAVADQGALTVWLRNYIAATREADRALRLFHVAVATDPSVESLLDNHRVKMIIMLGARYPAFDIESAPDRDRQMANAQLLIMRINQFVAIAARPEPCLPVEAGVGLLVEELATFIGAATVQQGACLKA